MCCYIQKARKETPCRIKERPERQLWTEWGHYLRGPLPWAYERELKGRAGSPATSGKRADNESKGQKGAHRR